MHYLITLLLIVFLAGIVFHDLKYLSIPLYILLPVIVIAGLRSFLLNDSGRLVEMAAVNMLGTILVLLVSCIILFVLKGRVFNPLNSLIGSGDLLFLPVLCISFSPMNYWVFFVVSLLLIVIFRLIYKAPGRYIPLAGIQSVILVIALILTEVASISLFDDQPILNLIL